MRQLKPYVRKANYYETDAMGIIHHGVYILWFEEARTDFLDQLGFGYDKTVKGGIDIAVLEAHCAYKSMVRFGDTVHVRAFIKKLSPVRMTVGYELTDAKTGELKTTGETEHCFLNSEDHGITRLNRSLPELYDLLAAQAEAE